MPIINLTPAELRLTIGLGMDQADYNLFVLGEVGSGHSSLLKQAMQTAASNRIVPPDLCYLHNFARRKGRRHCACRPDKDACCAS